MQKMRRNVALELLILIITIDALSKNPFFENFDPKNSKSTLYRHIKPPLKSKKTPFKIIIGGIRDFFFFLDAPYNCFNSRTKEGHHLKIEN